jgi:[glutamine synthetase] adenylyltransferase / [glutamine synthetase]-adenylyl-L-tyrosine phosphorylase
MDAMTPPPLPPSLEPLVGRALERLRRASPAADRVLADAMGAAAGRWGRLAVASDFALDTLERQPPLLERLLTDPDAPEDALPPLPAQAEVEWPTVLRRWRAAGSTRLVWRDVLGLDPVEATLAGSTRLAEACLGGGLESLEVAFVQRHGPLLDGAGKPQRLVVFALGKLGGGELNFSSDIDLVYAYPEPGESDGARPLAAEDWFARLGRQLAKLLDERTAEGFCHRVDLRLRPFGNAGRWP